MRSSRAAELDEVAAVLARSGLSSRQPAALEFHRTARGSRLFVGTIDDLVVAVGLSMSFGRTGWIGNIAVDPDWRGRGFGTAMSEEAVRWLTRRGVGTVLLSATDLGRPIYERLGFVSDGVTYGIWKRAADADEVGSETSCRKGAIRRALALDAEATGEDRRACLRPFGDRILVPGEGRDAGYRARLPWGGGPVIARDAEGARALVADMVEGDSDPTLAFPEQNPDASALADAIGFSPLRRVERMRLGPAVQGFRPQMIYNVFSLAVG